MATRAPDDQTELEDLKTGMRKQLDAKASLFDPLSASPSQKPDCRDDLRSTVRAGMALCFMAVGLGMFLVFVAWKSPEKPAVLVTSALMFTAMIGVNSFRAHSLLRERVEGLEKEVMELRRVVSVKGMDCG